jgi:HlyD family secretion protein
VVVAVDNPGGRLLPGMTANVRFVTAKRDDALKVPNTALRFRPAEALAESAPAPGARPPARDAAPAGRVWTLGRDGRPRAVAVTLGVTDGTWTEVVGGDLAEGQELLVGVETEQDDARGGTAAGPRL